jgi:hypothetical protein
MISPILSDVMRLRKKEEKIMKIESKIQKRIAGSERIGSKKAFMCTA